MSINPLGHITGQNAQRPKRFHNYCILILSESSNFNPQFKRKFVNHEILKLQTKNCEVIYNWTIKISVIKQEVEI